MVAKNVIQVEKWVEAHNNLLARFAKEGPRAQVILVSDPVLSALAASIWIFEHLENFAHQ